MKHGNEIKNKQFVPCKLPLEFYQDTDVLAISKALLGKFLLTKIGGKIITGGMIVETEAYRGAEDKASHAYGNRRTARTETMFASGGYCYVYLCYGIHNLFNVVTAPADTPHAVLIRAIEPTDGIATMLKRRNFTQLKPQLTAGPGALTQALGITTKHDHINLCGNVIWLEDRGITFSKQQIIASHRVGIAYAAEHAKLPWRFQLMANPYLSKAKDRA